MPLNLLSFGVACGLCWLSPALAAAFFLGLAACFLAGSRILSRHAEQAMQVSPLYSARAWDDSQSDALERYALYWRRPRLGRICFLGLQCLGWASAGVAAGPWLPQGAWEISALSLGFCGFLLRDARRFDPVAYFNARAAAKDFSVAEEHGAVLEIQAFMRSHL